MRLKEIEKEELSPEFWNDQERAKKLIGEKKAAKTVIDPIDGVIEALDDIETLVEMGADEGEELEHREDSYTVNPEVGR